MRQSQAATLSILIWSVPIFLCKGEDRTCRKSAGLSNFRLKNSFFLLAGGYHKFPSKLSKVSCVAADSSLDCAGTAANHISLSRRAGFTIQGDIMSISSIVQIAERLLNGNQNQDSGTSSKSKPAQAIVQGRNNQTEFGDRFTRSGQAGEENAAGETGFLQVEQLRFTALNIQANGGDATPSPPSAATPPAAEVTPAVAAAPATAVAATVSTGSVPLTTGGTIAAAAAEPTAVAPVAVPAAAVPQNAAANTVAQQTTTAATTPSTVQTQQDLQSLNASLSALGLNAAEIAAFDQFASVLLQFDPNALQDLQNQLNLLAAQFETQNAPATTAPATNSAAGAAPATTAAAQTPANPPGFQLNELSISFKGVQETVKQGVQNGGAAATTTLSAFSLQLKEVSVTLTNPAGQTTQVQTPQSATTPSAVAQAATA
jgi:hypothetical protein